VGISQERQHERHPATAVAGSTDAATQQFRVLYETHYGAVYAFALRRLIGSPDDASDATAEIFATAWRRMAHIPPPPEDRLWLFGVARRVLNRQQRGHRRRARLLARLQAEASVGSSVGADPDGAQGSHARVRAAIARLKPADRDVLSLVLWERLSHAEAALVLGCSINAVGLRLHQARARLRRELTADHGPDTGPPEEVHHRAH
jgi:RNA polymerase sigma-70 factor (ECF subfamily)